MDTLKNPTSRTLDLGMQPPTLPSRLFKYRAIDKFTSDIFCRRVLWFSRPDAFNDPYDCSPVFDWETTRDGLRAHLLEAWAEENPTWTKSKLLEKVNRAVQQGYPLKEVQKSRLQDEYQRRIALCGIFSASERDDSVVLWSHYADKHRGICLELDPSTLPPNAHFHKAQYTQERPVVNLIRDRKAANRIAAGTKSLEWAYEHEWRLVMERGPVSFPCEISLPDKMITGVILGTRISPNDRERAIDWCRALDDSPKVYQASLDPRRFRINRVELT